MDSPDGFIYHFTGQRKQGSLEHVFAVSWFTSFTHNITGIVVNIDMSHTHFFHYIIHDTKTWIQCIYIYILCGVYIYIYTYDIYI